MRNIKAIIPVKCHLWTKEKLNWDDDSQLKEKERYIDEDHLIRSLRECADCGQSYYYEFNEEIDWVNGNDPQYRTYIPINPDKNTIDTLNKASSLDLLGITPRLQKDWPADGKKTIRWIR